MESNCSLVLATVSHSYDDCSFVGHILEDCREYMSDFSSIITRHVFHELVNGVAHCLTHLASLSSIDDFWLDETPSIIEDVLYEDLCNCARGVDSSSLSSNVIINK